MNVSKKLIAAVIPATILTLAAFAYAYAAEQADDEDQEEVVSIASLPDAVEKAATEFFDSLENTTAEKEVEEGVSWFEVTGIKNGIKTGIKLTEAGDLVEIEQSSSYEKLPAAAQRELKKDFPGAEFIEVEAVEVHFYEVKVRTKDGTKEVRLFASGDIEDEDEEDGDDE